MPRVYYWTTKDGKKIDVDDMDINHLRNALKIVIKSIEASYNRKQLRQRTERSFTLKGEIAQMQVDDAETDEMMEDMDIDPKFYKY